MPVSIHIEYSSSGWSYGRRFKALSEDILKSVPDAQITGLKKRKASFEIKINDVLVFSKLESGHFPDYQDIVDQVLDVADNK